MNTSRKSGVTGLVLAGGQARRMEGRDKGLLEIGGITLAERIARDLGSQCEALLINANRNIPRYEQFGYPVVADTLGDYQGPLAGMLSGLRQINTEWMITVPCDGPFLSTHYVRRMHRAAESGSTCLATALGLDRLQPVYALLHHSLAPSLEAYLESGQRKIDRWFQQHEFATVDFTDEPDMFENINTPDQLQACINKFVSGHA